LISITRTWHLSDSPHANSPRLTAHITIDSNENPTPGDLEQLAVITGRLEQLATTLRKTLAEPASPAQGDWDHRHASDPG